jgi:hypothetical protein
MSSDSTITKPTPDLRVETKVSSYDLVNGMLLASIIIVGFLVSVLFLIWLTTAFDFSKRRAPVAMEVSQPGDEKPKGVADDVLEPGVEEFPELETPQLANALESVTDAVSSVRAALEKRSGDAAQMGKGSGFGSREGGPGTGGDGIPEYKRWIINYESDNIDAYAQQLSFFNIDVGVIPNTSGDNDIWRIHDVGGAASVIKTNRDAENKTLRFSHKKMRMQRWDQILARRQGVEQEDAIIVQFYPEETRQIIRQVELDALQGTGKEVSDIRNTIFKVEREGDGFVFKVVDILYR